MFVTIISFVLVLGLLIFVHELGHFLSAKKIGMKVEEFGFGYPPRIWGWRHPKSGTVYSLNWIPVGGFVKIKGESGENRDDPDSFAAKKPGARFLVLAAGVAMNWLLAIVLLSVGFMLGLPSAVDENTPANAQVRDEAIRVVRVLEGGPAAAAGLAPGDQLVSLDDRLVNEVSDVSGYLAGVEGREVKLTLRHENGDYFTVYVTPQWIEQSQVLGIGIGLLKTGIVSFAPPAAIYHGVLATGTLTVEIMKAFSGLARSLISQEASGLDISGPVGIAVMTGQYARLGLSYLLQFAAILSINLAFINLLPFPALDGGRILFLIIEKVRRRPVNAGAENIAHAIGFFLLMAIVVAVTYKDFVRYGGQMWGGIKSLFGM